MRTVRILVTGSRVWADADMLERALNEAAAGYAAVTIRHGQCNPRNSRHQIVHWNYALKHPEEGPYLGADWMADRYALRRGWPIERFPADWNTYGNPAGMIRNRQMVDTTPRPTLVVGFPLGDSPGTRGCLAYADKNRVRTIDATKPPQPDGLW